MKKSILYILMLHAFSISAQPVLTLNDIGYEVGQAFQGHNGAWMDPGSAGANQTWDFTGFVESTSFTINFVDPASTANGASFPGATVGLSLSAAPHIAYYESNASIQALLGISANGTNIFYSDREEYARFPVTYGDQFTDEIYSAFYSGANWTRDGDVDINVDGYGTVTLPNGTVVTDVLRVHASEEYEDVVVGQPSSAMTTTTNLYFYYKAGTHYPIVNIAMVSNPMQSGGYMEYIDYTPQGISNRYNLSVRTYPNPVTERVYLNSSEIFETITIISSSGAIVRSETTDGTMGLDVKDLVPGIYFLEARNRDNEIFRSKFIKN